MMMGSGVTFYVQPVTGEARWSLSPRSAVAPQTDTTDNNNKKQQVRRTHPSDFRAPHLTAHNTSSRAYRSVIAVPGSCGVSMLAVMMMWGQYVDYAVGAGVAAEDASAAAWVKVRGQPAEPLVPPGMIAIESPNHDCCTTSRVLLNRYGRYVPFRWWTAAAAMRWSTTTTA